MGGIVLILVIMFAPPIGLVVLGLQAKKISEEQKSCTLQPLFISLLV
jgi:hypothetical protein